MTFYAKPAIRYFARPALLIIVLPLLAISIFLDINFIPESFLSITQNVDILQNIRFIFIIILFNIMSLIVVFVYFVHLHEKCFAKIVINNSLILWKCVFRKSITMNIETCRFIGVESEDSFNKIDYPFVYFSVLPYPREYVHKINKMQNTTSFIKFWYTDEIAKYIIDSLPKEKTGRLQYYRRKAKERHFRS